jgi:hypothetical protein
VTQFQPFEDEVAIVEPCKQLSCAYGVAGAGVGFKHEAVEGRDNGALDLAFHRGIGGDAIEASPSIAEHKQGQRCDGEQLAHRVAGAEQADDLVAECIACLDDEPAVILPLFIQHGRGNGADAVEHGDRGGMERVVE